MLKKRRKILGIKLLIPLAALIVLVAGGEGLYQAAWGKERIAYAQTEAGSITHEAKVEATFANSEVLLQAPVAGKVSFYSKEGVRFRRGTGVAEILPEGVAPGTTGTAKGVTVSAVIGGLIYQEVDGIESIFTPEHLLSMDLGKLLSEKETPKKIDRVQAGEAFAKMVDNLAPTYAFIRLSNLNGLDAGKNMLLKIAGEAESAKILRKSENPLGVVVQFSRFLDRTVKQRHQSIDWVMSPPVQGLLVPKTALWEQGEKKGVFAVVEGVIRFKDVKVLDQDTQWVCVTNLQEGSLVVTNPRPGLEGKAVKN